MWVMSARGSHFTRPAYVWGVNSLKGCWYVIRPSCLVQPLYSSVAVPVTNSWPLRCANPGKVKRESGWNWTKDDGWLRCMMCNGHCFFCIQPRGWLSFPMKSNYTWIINVLVLDLRWYLLVWSWVGVCQVPARFVVFVYLGCLCIITGFIFILTFIFTSGCLQCFIYFIFSPFFLGVSVHACVCRYMCNWAKTILKGDIRDGWITENLLKRDNPSCTLIRHTPWFSNGIFSIISAVTAIPSRHSAQLSTALSLL